MAIGMFCICRFTGKLKPNQRHHRRGGIRKIVHGIRDDRNTAEKNPRYNLPQKKKQIRYNPHESGKFSIPFPNLWGADIRIIFYK